MYIPQKQLYNLEHFHIPGKVVVIYGARRVGKTTLLNKVKEKYQKNVLFVNGDDQAIFRLIKFIMQYQ